MNSQIIMKCYFQPNEIYPFSLKLFIYIFHKIGK